MPTKLRKLKITRVAVCPQGANPDADILLFKSAGPVDKQEGVTVGDVYPETFVGTTRCTDPQCHKADCPVHGTRRTTTPVDKFDEPMGMHPEPDGDERVPLDYASRTQQYDLWEQLWQKWQYFAETVFDVLGDSDSDNVPHLPILARSVQQFHDDIQRLLEAGGVVEKVAPALAVLAQVAKAGAPMAGHRLTRFRDALSQLQQILEECTPEEVPHGILPPIDRAGVSAAQAAGLPGYMKGDLSMADPHSAILAGNVAQTTIDALTARAQTAEARVAELEATLAKMRQTPDEQEAEYWASVPEPVRKKHEADEAEKVELRKQLDDARAEREQTVFIAKTADFRAFGMVAKHWRILKAIEGMEAEDRDELLRLMKAAQEQARTAGLYTASGTDGHAGATPGGGSASDQLMALTTAYMDEKGVDFLKASEAIAKSHRDLYAEANRERRLASRVSSQ